MPSDPYSYYPQIYVLVSQMGSTSEIFFLQPLIENTSNFYVYQYF